MSLNKFTPIAMKCNKEQWEDIKPLLVKDNILTRHITSFDHNTWLTNNYMDIKLNISNVSICSVSFFKRKIYTEWDKNIFLNACEIETEVNFIVNRWYKVIYNTSRNFYIKYKKTSKCGNKIEGESITDGLYRKYYYWSAGDFIKQALNTGPLVDLTEIQEYLPDNHVDKFKPKFTIADLASGKCAVINDGTEEELNKVLQMAFPYGNQEYPIQGINKYYHCIPHYKQEWTFTNGEINLPTQSVKDFLIDAFILPEKWCILRTEENADTVNSFFSKPENNKEGYLYIDNTGYLISEYLNTCNWIGAPSIKPDEDYTEITFEQFKKYILKQDNMNTINIDKRFPFYLDPRNAQRIIDIACSTWKPKLASMWAHNMVLGNSIEISEEFYKEMRNACSVEQHRLFDSIFGKDVEDFPYKVNDWITINGVVVKITEINTDSSHIYWIKHTPNANTGGGFSFKCYKNRIRFATSEEIAKAICPYKDGELIWVKTDGVWILRYSNGKITSSGDAEVYYNQLKDGSVIRWPIHRKAEGITLPE